MHINNPKFECSKFVWQLHHSVTTVLFLVKRKKKNGVTLSISSRARRNYKFSVVNLALIITNEEMGELMDLKKQKLWGP